MADPLSMVVPALAGSILNPVLIFYNADVRTSAFLALSAFLLSSCKPSETRTYRVPKESESIPASGDGAGIGRDLPVETPFSEGELPEGHPPLGDLPPGHPEISGGDGSMANAAAQGVAPPPVPHGEVVWVVPPGWKEKPGSGFRYATFIVPGSGGLEGDLSVTVLEGEAGGLLSNVNRWRNQIGLPELTEVQFPSASKILRLSGRSMTFVSFVSTDKLIDGKFQKRITAAVYSSDGRTWFFKLIGEDRLVRSAESDFLKFLKSMKGL